MPFDNHEWAIVATNGLTKAQCPGAQPLRDNGLVCPTRQAENSKNAGEHENLELVVEIAIP